MRRLLILVTALLALVPTFALAQGQDALKPVQQHLVEAKAAAERDDVAMLRREYDELHTAWVVAEDGVRAKNANVYRGIEEALASYKAAAFANPADLATVKASLETIEHEIAELGIAAPKADVKTGSDPKAEMQRLNGIVEEALTAARAGDVTTARAKYSSFEEGWFAAEDSVRDASRDAYVAIETAMGDVRVALKAQPVDASKLAGALSEIEKANESFVDGTSALPAPTEVKPTLATLLPKLGEARDALKRGDGAKATQELDEFRQGWPEVEGVVAAKDAGTYKRSEELMAKAAAEIRAANSTAALASIDQLEQGLQPYATAGLKYGIFDAAAILLREGLEALLIIAALLAFLQKSGNGDKRRWVWGGGLAGVVLSVVGAVLIQLFFSTIISGTNRELIEGVTGLVAAVMLFYVSFWLHRRTQIQGWQQYIREKTNAALATGSLFSLTMLAFLAVFREGAETTLFYIGIAPAIAQRDLLLGLGIATAVLVVVGIAIIGLGRRIPLKPFFQITSLLIFYLGFKFIGAGINALQVARVLPASTSSYLPSIDLIGLYPTWESTLLQLLMLGVAVAVVLWFNRRTPTARVTA